MLHNGLPTARSQFDGTAHSLSFDYAAFNRGHVTQDIKGGVGDIAEDGFNFEMATDADGLGPAIAGEAIRRSWRTSIRSTRTCSTTSAGRARAVGLSWAPSAWG